MIMHLEGLDLPKLGWRELAMALEAGLRGQPMPIPPPTSQALAASDLAQQGVKDALRYAEIERKGKAESRNVSVDLDNVRVSLSRSLGPELVGHAFCQRLGFPGMLAACGLDLYQRDLAEAVILGRLIAPDSDLGTWRWLRARTSLPEFVASDLEKAGKDAVYEVADALGRNRAALETGLRKRENALYPRGETLVLYDLTNSHFEGRCLGNPLAKRGHSKQTRSDCPLGTLARVLCFSEGRLEKERGRDRLKEARILEDLEKARKAVAKGSLKDSQKANQRIGRLLERYPSIASRDQITLAPAEDP